MSFWLHGFCGQWKGWDLVNRFYHNSWVAIVDPTDCPNSVRNRCVNEVFGGVFVLSRCFFNFSVGVRAFDIWLSQSLPFLLLLADWIFLKFMHMLINWKPSQYLNLNLPFKKMVLFLKLPGFFNCICIFLHLANNYYFKLLYWKLCVLQWCRKVSHRKI